MRYGVLWLKMSFQFIYCHCVYNQRNVYEGSNHGCRAGRFFLRASSFKNSFSTILKLPLFHSWFWTYGKKNFFCYSSALPLYTACKPHKFLYIYCFSYYLFRFIRVNPCYMKLFLHFVSNAYSGSGICCYVDTRNLKTYDKFFNSS